jgi:hypothetical protein
MSLGIILAAIFGLVFVLVLVGAAFWYLHRAQHAKDIERSIKMVPLLVQLPPAEEEASQRDERERIKENITRAEGIFTLLSGIKTSRFLYSQRHIAFELVAQGERIYFYVGVPAALVSSVEKALVAGYPTVQIKQVTEHNIFSESGKIGTVAGGELSLTQKSMYPVQTYKTLDFDPMSGILSSLSRLKAGEGAAVQIMIRPAPSKWSKNSRNYAKGLLNPQRAKANDPMNIASQIARAPFGTPDWQAKEQMNDPTKQADTIDQKQAQSIEEKASEPAFQTLIRFVTSSDDLAKSRMIVQDLVNGFAQFNQPGSNGFEFHEARTPRDLARDFIFRTFPRNHKDMILNTTELATVFHLPDAASELATPLERKGRKEVSAPADLPEKGIVIGSNFFQGKEKIVRLSDEDRKRHMYIIGQTGTGKSVTLRDLIVQDMALGKGLCVIDPHGELADEVLACVPRNRIDDVIYFNPADLAVPLGLNIMEFDPAHPEQKDFIIQEVINMLYKLYDPDKQGIIGPRFEHWFRMAALTIMSDPQGATFLEVPKPFVDDEYLKEKFKFVTDTTVQDFWINEMGQTSDYHKSEMLGWFVSKWGAFQSNEVMRNIIGQHKSAFNFPEIMDESKILIVNLSKGQTGTENSRLLGMIFVIKILAAALGRSGRAKNEMPQFSLYVDEFQNFSTDSFATILSEARKYNLSLIVANQFIGQLSEEIKGAVFGNVGTLMTFRCGPEDAEFLEKQFEPSFDRNDLVNIPNLQGAIKLMAGGLPTIPFSVHPVFPPVGQENAEMAMHLRELTRQKFGRPKPEVEAEVRAQLHTRGEAGAEKAEAAKPEPVKA